MEILVIVLLIIMLVGVIAFASKEEAKAKPPESKLPDVPKPPTPKEPAPVEVKPVPPPAPTPGVDSRRYIRVVKGPSKQPNGLQNLIVELREGDTLLDSVVAVSGQPDAQNFVTDAGRGFGTGEPLGERYYTLGKPDWKGGVAGDWSKSHGAGLGPVWISLFPDDHVYGIHMDANMADSPGTMGCLGIQSKKYMETLLSWFADPRTAPKLLVVNWGLKSVETKGMGYKSYGAPFDPHPKSAWEKLVEATKSYKAEFPKLKAIALAQWIVESGRGTSKLAIEANNFGGMKYREELVAKVPGVSKYFYDEGRGEEDKNYFKCETPSVYIALYWAFMDRAPYVGWREAAKKGAKDYLQFIANAGYMGGPNAPQAQKDAYVTKILAVLPEALSLLGEKAEPTSPTPTAPQTTAKDLLGLKVAIDVGHGLYAEEGGGMEYGAEGNGRREWDLNRLQGEELKKLLEARGAVVDVYCYHTGGTNERLTLSQKGMKGKNHHIFISCHHNAANNHANYSCTMLSSTANRHKPDDRKLAAAISDRLGAIMGFGLGGDEDGIIESPLGVFSRRLTDWSDCRACCLVESYFIDSDKLAGQDFSALSRKAAGAIASGIANYAKSIGLV